jgi:hypothetical protein
MAFFCAFLSKGSSKTPLRNMVENPYQKRFTKRKYRRVEKNIER